MKGLFRTPKKPDSRQSASATDLDEVSDHRAEDNETALKTAEELFKASLQAKKNEIENLHQTLKGVRAELFQQVRETSFKNEKLAQTEDEIQDKEEEVLALRGKVTSLEEQISALRARYKSVVRGARPGGMDGAGEEWQLKDDEMSTLRARADNALRQGAELEGTVDVLKAVLLELWREGEGEKGRGRGEEGGGGEEKEALWEETAGQQRRLVREMLAEAHGKEELVRSLRAQLAARS